MPSHIMCGTGTPDSTSSHARQLMRKATNHNYVSATHTPRGAPQHIDPYNNESGLLIRLVAIGSVGKFLGGFFFPSSSMKLKSIDLEVVPWNELDPDVGMSEANWIDEYVTPNFEAQIVGGCYFELGKAWSEDGGFYTIPNDIDERDAYDLFRQSNPYGFEIVDGRVVVYLNFLVEEGSRPPPPLEIYDISSDDDEGVDVAQGSRSAREAHSKQEVEGEESIYDSDGPGSNYQRKNRPVGAAVAKIPTKFEPRLSTPRRNPQLHKAAPAPKESSDVDSSTNDDDSDGDSDSDSSGSGSEGSSGSGEDDSDMSSDSEPERLQRHLGSQKTTNPAPNQPAKQTPNQPAKRGPNQPVKRAPNQSAKQTPNQPAKRAPPKTAKRAPIQNNNRPSHPVTEIRPPPIPHQQNTAAVHVQQPARDVEEGEEDSSSCSSGSESSGSSRHPDVSDGSRRRFPVLRARITNPRKRPRAEQDLESTTGMTNAGDSIICIKIEDEEEAGYDSGAGPAARTRGAASRRPAAKKTRFSEGC